MIRALLGGCSKSAESWDHPAAEGPFLVQSRPDAPHVKALVLGCTRRSSLPCSASQGVASGKHADTLVRGPGRRLLSPVLARSPDGEHGAVA